MLFLMSQISQILQILLQSPHLSPQPSLNTPSPIPQRSSLGPQPLLRTTLSSPPVQHSTNRLQAELALPELQSPPMPHTISLLRQINDERIKNQLEHINTFSIHHHQQICREKGCIYTLIHKSQKKIEYLEINLTKEVKDLCNEDLKPLKKEIKTLRNGKTFQTYELLELMV